MCHKYIFFFFTLPRFGGWADQSVGNWHQRKQIIGEHAPVQRSGKRRFKRSERDGKKERTKQSRDEGGIGCKKLDWKLWECAQINVCTHCTMCCTNHGACSHCEAKTHKSTAQNFAETLTICWTASSIAQMEVLFPTLQKQIILIFFFFRGP